MENYFVFDLKTKEKDEKLKMSARELLDAANANADSVEKADIEEYYNRVSSKIHECQMELRGWKAHLNHWEDLSKDSKAALRILKSEVSTKAELLNKIEQKEKELKEWTELGDELDLLRNKNKNFNKSICFSNIRELLKQNPNVKIGQIEREAGIRLGYMSRLEKEGNTAEPSMEFIVTAAKLLNVSVDTLISVDLANLNTTEEYLINFLSKLQLDTVMGKLDWNVETPYDIERQVDVNGINTHPLYSLETFFRQTECEYPEEVTENVYVSKTFGPNTCINGDCFNIKLKNGSILYLMDLVKDCHRVNDKSAFVIEAVIHVPHGKNQVLVTSKDDYLLGDLLIETHSKVKEFMKHPKVSSDVRYVIDAFMNDDLSDDLPF